MKRVCEIYLDVESPVVRCSVADPFLLILTASGEVRQVTFVEGIINKDGVAKPSLELTAPPVSQVCIAQLTNT